MDSHKPKSRRWLRDLIAALGCAATCAAASPGVAQPTRQALAGAWAGEDRYWATNVAGDVANYLTMFDEQFTGWPCAAERPSTKADLRALGNRLLEPRKIGVSLEDKAASGGADSVVTYYRARIRQRAPDGSLVTVLRDFTHTWVKRTDGWRIVGGMCREDTPAK
jgi:hypothetical protein